MLSALELQADGSCRVLASRPHLYNMQGRLLSSLDEPVDCYGSKLAEPIETLESAVDMVEAEQATMFKRMQDIAGGQGWVL